MTLPTSRDPTLWSSLLQELDRAGGSASPKAVYPKLQMYFPSVTSTELAQRGKSGTNTWQNRIQWACQHLVQRGYLDRSQPGVWKITSAGQQWLAQNPPPKANGPPHDKNGGQVVREVPLTQRLTEDQRKGATPDLFEQSIAAAFAFLGFEATHVGGPGNTDVFARAPLGSETYSTTIDGKSSQNGKITNGQIDWYAIEGHREANKAKYAAVIGESFAGGDLLRNAQKAWWS